MVRQAFADPGSASPGQKWVHGAVGLRVGPSRAPDNNSGQLSGYEHSANDPFIEPALREERESQVISAIVRTLLGAAMPQKGPVLVFAEGGSQL